MSTVAQEDVEIDIGNPATGKTSETEDGQEDKPTDKLKDNPYVENMQTGGAQLRIPERVPLLPRPWKKIKHVIIVSYVCYLFLIFPGAIANQYAWEAKKYKDLGSRAEARSMIKAAVCWIYVGFAIGIAIVVILCIVLPLTI